jgi:hypothetical protein
MHDQQYEAHNEGNVNDSGGDVKGEESEQPKNNQYYCDHCKHVFHPLRIGVARDGATLVPELLMTLAVQIEARTAPS